MEIIRLLNDYNIDDLKEYLRKNKGIVICSDKAHLGYLFDNEIATLNAISSINKGLLVSSLLRHSGFNIKTIDYYDIGFYTNNNFTDAIIERIDPLVYMKYYNHFDAIITQGGIGLYNGMFTKIDDDYYAISLAIRLNSRLIYFKDLKSLENDFDITQIKDSKALNLLLHHQLEIIGDYDV